VVDEKTKVLFNFLVNAFSLTISLGVVRCRGVASYANKFVERLHEFGDELSAAITDDLFGKSVVAKDMVAEDFGCS
jgi:hypothetical protein